MVFDSARRRTAQLGRVTIILILALGITGGLVWAQSNRDSQNLRGSKVLLETLGMPSLAISTDCVSTNNLLEGLCGCLSEIPGGYCYHNDCDTVAPPEFLEVEKYTLKRE